MKLQPHSFADKVVFVGAVAGVLPPVGCTGVEMVANEMEGELAMAGIKEGAKWTPVDFRNPCVSIDFGTTLDGRITSDVDESAEIPFAKTIGNFAGLAGAIPDAIVRGTGLVQQRTGTALDLFSDRSTLGKLTSRTNRGVVDDYVERMPRRDRHPDRPVRPGPLRPRAALRGRGRGLGDRVDRLRRGRQRVVRARARGDRARVPPRRTGSRRSPRSWTGSARGWRSG